MTFPLLSLYYCNQVYEIHLPPTMVATFTELNFHLYSATRTAFLTPYQRHLKLLRRPEPEVDR